MSASTGATSRASRWALPQREISALLILVLVGLLGLAWSQRGIFVRVAQTAQLVEAADDPAHPGDDDNIIDASLTWRFDASGTDGPAIVADIDIPANSERLVLTIRRNKDESLPASHIISVKAEQPTPFDDKSIAAIDLPVAKPTPDADGEPLIGSVAEMGAQEFWVGLSPDPNDLDINMRLLAEAGFFDLPLTYKSGQHATLTFEKGRTGAAVFKQGLPALTQ